MARRLGLAARGWGAPARPIAARGAGEPVGEGAPPRADLGVGIAAAAAGSTAGPAGPHGGRWGGRRRGRASPAPRCCGASPSGGSGAGPGERGRPAGRWGPRARGKLGSLGRRRWEGRRGGGEGRAATPPRAPRPPPRAEPRVAAGAAALSRFPPQGATWRLRAGPGGGRSSHADGEISRCGASERRADLYRRGTCPSASRGLLSMERGASRRPRRAGSRRARLGDLARRRRRRPRQRLLP